MSESPSRPGLRVGRGGGVALRHRGLSALAAALSLGALGGLLGISLLARGGEGKADVKAEAKAQAKPEAKADAGTSQRAEEDAEPFTWKASYAEALRLAVERRRPFFVYFPPTAGEAEPAILADAPKVLGAPPLVEGVRVGAAEVVDLVRRLQVKEVPTVILLDRRENILHRWDGKIPAGFWRTVQSIILRLGSREQAAERMLREALKKSQSGDLEGAYRKVTVILVSADSPPEALAKAREIEASLLRSVRERMLKALAGEGLSSDDSIVHELTDLRSSTQHPGLQEEIGREISRLKRLTVGAR